MALSLMHLSGVAQAAAVSTHWDTKKLITIPGSFAASAQSERSVAELRFSATGGDSLTCYYSKVGAAFRLQDCKGPREERESFGAFNEWIGMELSSRAGAGDQVIADNIALTLPACPRGATCASPLALAVIGGQPAEACEGTATANLHVLGDVACGTSGFALRFNAVGKRLEGYGHSIKAPSAMVGVFVTGSKIQVSRLNVSGVHNGIGLQAYNATNLVVQNGEFRQNMMGINVYSDGLSPEHVAILRNNLSDNSWVGLRFNAENGKGAVNPYIRGNDLSRSGYFALWLDVKSVYLHGHFNNRFDGSTNGAYFLNGDAVVNHLDLSKAGIHSAALFFNNNRNVFVAHSDLSYSVAGTPNQDRVAIHLYRVANAVVNDVTVKSGDVGVKVATDGGVAANVSILRSTIKGESLSAVMVQSYDGTTLGRLDFERNDFSGNANSVWMVGATQYAPGSVFLRNLQ